MMKNITTLLLFFFALSSTQLFGQGTALDFDGVNDNVDLGNLGNVLDNTNQATYQAWIKLNSNPGAYMSFIEANSGVGQYLSMESGNGMAQDQWPRT